MTQIKTTKRKETMTKTKEELSNNLTKNKITEEDEGYVLWLA